MAAAGAPALPELLPAFPNPFNARTTLQLRVHEAGLASLRLYDVRGKLVALLVQRPEPAGYRSVTWDGRDGRGAAVASGVYFARLETSAGTRNQRLVLLAK